VLPKYAVEEVAGEPHEQWFVASCEVPALALRERGEGSSRRKAEQEAAQRVLATLARELEKE
jgi:ribonuclease-3